MTLAGTCRGLAQIDHALFLVSSRPVSMLKVITLMETKVDERIYVSLDEFREINVPYLKGNREREQLNAPLVYLETFLKVLIFFEE
jgi:hypothetical protein